MEGRQRRRIATEMALAHGGVISRGLLRAARIDDADIRAEVRADRWVTHGLQTVATHTRALTVEEQRWHAVWETGERVAALDGVTALLVAGLTGYDESTIHLSVVHSHKVKALDGVRVHKITRRSAGEMMPTGIARTRPDVAALRAAHWAKSDRQAALILVMTVQQGLCTAQQLLDRSAVVRGRMRRAFIVGVIRDLALGVRSLGELDFAKLCRARGLPEPVRQQVRQDHTGRAYLDVRWDCGLVVEIDGIHHFRGLAPVDDQLRQNRVALSKNMVLRIPNIGLRLQENEFMAQVEAGLRQRGAIAV